MAEEKPSTCVAAQLWVSDQRSRWNDLGSLHLADIDLLLDKQLQWFSDHSNVESLLKLVPSKTDSISPNINTLPQLPALKYTQNVDHSTEKETDPISTVSALHEDGAQQSDANNDIDLDSQNAAVSASIDDVDVKPAQEEREDEEMNSLSNNHNEIGNNLPNYVEKRSFLGSYNVDGHKHKETSAQLEPESLISDAKTKENDDFLLSWPIVPLLDNTKTPNPDIHEERDAEGSTKCIVEHADPQETELAQSDNSPVIAVKQLDTNDTEYNPAQLITETSSIKPSSSEPENTKDNIIANDINDIAAESPPEFAPRTPAQHIVESSPINPSSENESIQNSINANDFNEIAAESPPEFAPTTPAQLITESSPIKFSSNENESIHNSIIAIDFNEVAAESPPEFAPRTPEADEDQVTPQLEESIQNSDKLQKDTVVCEKNLSSPRRILPSLEFGETTNILKKDFKDDVSEPQESTLVPTMPAFTEPSPPERTKTNVVISPAQENIPPSTTPSATQTNHVSSVHSSDSHYDDLDDDEDEIILVGDKSSARWSRPAMRRVSKMPIVDRTRPVRRALHVPERQVKPIRTTSTPLTKLDNDSPKGQPQSSKALTSPNTKTPVADEVSLPLDEHETSNILWVNSSDRPANHKSIDENQSTGSSLPGSTLMAKLQGVHTDKSWSKKTSEDSSPIERLQKRLDEVLQDVDRNSNEINKSLSGLHKKRQHPNSKTDMGRGRLPHHMSPTMSHLKRLEVQNAMHHKLQAKLTSVQPTSHSSSIINKDKYSTNAPVYTSGWQARPEASQHQVGRKKRLGILNGMNAERLKLIQQRSKLQERDLQKYTTKSEGNPNTRSNIANARDASKVTSSHSFAKSTLSTQLKTHKPMESVAKLHHNTSTLKHLTVNMSKAHDGESIRTKPMAAPTDRPAPASNSSSQHAINSFPATPSKKDKNMQVIPKATDKNADSQDDDSRPRKRPKLPIPGWAMSPELKKALEEQCTLNPEKIFGKMAPLRIEEIFTSRKSSSIS